MSTKGIVILLDGLGDRPVASLDGQTPLEAARTPHLDRLAAEGSCGLMDPLYPGVPVDTHTGSGAILGLTRRTLHRLPRGPVEAAGAGMSLRPGDVTLRCNFATLRKDGSGWEVLDRRAGRIAEGTEALGQALEGLAVGEALEATFRPTTGHRGVLRLHGRELSGDVTDTDPGDRATPKRLLTCRARAAGDVPAMHAAEAVNRFLSGAHERLSVHPVNREREAAGLPAANGILTRGAGLLPPIETWLGRLGVSAAVVAGERTVLGLAELAGYTPVTRPGFTSDARTDYAGKVAAALEALERHDVVFLHVKATDNLSHDRDSAGKRDALQHIDAALEPLVQAGHVVCVTGDHSTDSSQGVHTGDPVPALLYAPNGRRDRCGAFGETRCSGGGLGRLTATQLVISFLDHLGVMPTFQTSRWQALDVEL